MPEFSYTVRVRPNAEVLRRWDASTVNAMAHFQRLEIVVTAPDEEEAHARAQLILNFIKQTGLS